jgi:hypothetical protein
LADSLADQRAYLAEQVGRLADARKAGADELAGLLGEVDDAAREVAAREEAVARRAQALAEVEGRLRAEQSAARQTRLHLEAWGSRLTVREASWQAEQDRLRTDLDFRRSRTERRERALAELCRRWSRRRAEELGRLRAELRHCEELRRLASDQTTTAERQGQAVRQEQQALAEQALALEQARQDLFGQSDNPAAAAKRLERLRRHWSGRTAAAERDLEKRRKALVAEAARLNERLRQAQARSEELTAEEVRFADERAEWERGRTVAELTAVEPAAARWPAERDRYERQLAELRGEVERLAHLLIEEPVQLSLPAQAA